jgi:hypothetical protein
MRIVCISDTHGHLSEMDIPEGDVLIHAGDFTMSGQGKQIKKFRLEIEALPHPYKIVIAGNHDLKFERDPERALQLLGREVYYLEDSGVKIDGVEFWGHPWTPPFGHGWAFNSDNPPVPPPGIDVLVSHGPPRGRLDVVDRGGMRVGCTMLAKYVEEHELKLHVFGHIHEGYGQDGIFVNACACTLDYRPKNPPIVVDL